VRIRYDITLDSITQDSTQFTSLRHHGGVFCKVPTTQPLSGKWPKSSSRSIAIASSTSECRYRPLPCHPNKGTPLSCVETMALLLEGKVPACRSRPRRAARGHRATAARPCGRLGSRRRCLVPISLMPLVTTRDPPRRSPKPSQSPWAWKMIWHRISRINPYRWRVVERTCPSLLAGRALIFAPRFIRAQDSPRDQHREAGSAWPTTTSAFWCDLPRCASAESPIPERSQPRGKDGPGEVAPPPGQDQRVSQSTPSMICGERIRRHMVSG
jgi:hypothetical protein